MRRCLTLATVLFAILLALPATAQNKPKDELVIGMTQYPSTFHPNIGSMLAKRLIQGMTLRNFTVFDKDWKLVCLLCTELPTIENGLARVEEIGEGRQGIAATYTIHPGARWGDGTPVTTKDVMFTWEMGRSPQSMFTSQEVYRRILKIDVKDDKTFTLHFDRVSYQYNAINDFQLIPAHLEKPVFDASPAEYGNRNGYDTNPTQPGLYFGPYRVVRVTPGSEMVLEPNPTWYGKKPFFKRITFRIIENTAALEANLLSGSIDYILGELGLSLDQALAFEKRHGKRFDVVYKPSLIYEHIDLNLENPLLKDKRVRQALLYGIDRNAISQKLFEGKQPVADTQTSPLDPTYTDDVRKYAYDPKKAAELLDAAGFSELRGGVRHTRDGERLSLEMTTTAGNRVRELVQQVLQSQWRQIGVEVRIRNEPPRVFSAETLNRRKISGMAMYAWYSSPENVPRTTLHSEEIPTAENGWRGQNYPAFRNAEMDATLEAMETELDAAKRQALAARMQQIYAEELPILPLYFRSEAYILPKWLKGIEPTGHQYVSTLWVENWYAE